MVRHFLGPADVDVIGQAVCRALSIDVDTVTEVHLHLAVAEMPTATVECLLPAAVLPELVTMELTNLRAAAGRRP